MYTLVIEKEGQTPRVLGCYELGTDIVHYLGHNNFDTIEIDVPVEWDVVPYSRFDKVTNSVIKDEVLAEEARIRDAQQRLSFLTSLARSYRNDLLNRTDVGVVTPDFPISADDKAALLTARQQLRDFDFSSLGIDDLRFDSITSILAPLSEQARKKLKV